MVGPMESGPPKEQKVCMRRIGGTVIGLGVVWVLISTTLFPTGNGTARAGCPEQRTQ